MILGHAYLVRSLCLFRIKMPYRLKSARTNIWMRCCFETEFRFATASTASIQKYSNTTQQWHRPKKVIIWILCSSVFTHTNARCGNTGDHDSISLLYYAGSRIPFRVEPLEPQPDHRQYRLIIYSANSRTSVHSLSTSDKLYKIRH